MYECARVRRNDEVIGKIYCAGAEGRFGRGEYFDHPVIHSEGMADCEYPLAKAKGTLHMPLLEDSFTASD